MIDPKMSELRHRARLGVTWRERAPGGRFLLSGLIGLLLAGAPFAALCEGGIEPSVGEPKAPEGQDAERGAQGEAADRAAPVDEGSAAESVDGEAAAKPVDSEEVSEPAPDLEVVEQPPQTLPAEQLKAISPQEAAGILGKRVIAAAGDDIGMVVDVLIDSEGAPRAAVIDFGGFLGVGNRKIAVDWALLQFRPGDQYAPILLDVTGEAIAAAPEYRLSDDSRFVVAPPAPPPAPAEPPPALDIPADGQEAPSASRNDLPEAEGARGQDAPLTGPVRDATPKPRPNTPVKPAAEGSPQPARLRAYPPLGDEAERVFAAPTPAAPADERR